MTKFQGKYRIESNRWQYWDYSNLGQYFITICIQDRECILGKIENQKMTLSEYGVIVKNEILKMPEYHHRVILDEWTIMPNHIHLLIVLGDDGYHNGAAGGRVGDDGNGGNGNDNGGNGGGDNDGDDDVDKIHEFYLPTSRPPQPYNNPTDPSSHVTTTNPWWHNHHHKPTIDEIKQYRKQRRKMIIPMILGKMKMQTSKHINIARNTPGQKNWQHDYHDHIIRNNESYFRIKNYIINNPQNWGKDRFNDNNK